MITRVEIDGLPPEDVRLAWCDWLRHHGIDPTHVAFGFIEADSATWQIRYVAYDLNDQGCRYATPDLLRASTSVRVVQLAAPPAPFPEAAHRSVTG